MLHARRSSAIRPGRRGRVGLCVAALLALLATGCGGEGGGSALGGTADVTSLASFDVGSVPAEPLAWITDEYRLAAGGELEHSHEPAFAYARSGASLLGSDELEPGEAAAVAGGSLHRHAAPDDAPAVIWETRLARPGSAPPASGRRVFAGPPLQGIPPAPLASFLLVRIPPGGETSVHTHPGPELIYELRGRIRYQNGLIGTVPL